MVASSLVGGLPYKAMLARRDRDVGAGLPIQPSTVPAAFEALRVSEEVESKPEAWVPAKNAKCGPRRAPPGLHAAEGVRLRGDERVSFQGPLGTWSWAPWFSRGRDPLIPEAPTALAPGA